MKRALKPIMIALAAIIAVMAAGCEQIENFIDIDLHSVYTVSVDGEEQKVVDGGMAIEPQVDARDNEVFVEWQSEGEAFSFSTPITKNTEIVSVWEEYGVLDGKEFQLSFSVTADEKTATSVWTGSYNQRGVRFVIEVTDSELVTSDPDIGLHDNVEINLQAKPSLGYNRAYTLNFLFDAAGNHWVRRATNPTTLGAHFAYNTFATKGINYDYVTETTETGYKVTFDIDYTLLGVSKNECIGNLLFMPSMRNVNAGGTEWDYFRATNGLFHQPSTYLTLKENGNVYLKAHVPADIEAAAAAKGALKNDLPLIENLATLTPNEHSGIQPFVVGCELFTDRTYRGNMRFVPQALIGASYIYGSIEGSTSATVPSSATVTAKGYVVVAAPAFGYPLVYQRLAELGFKKVISETYNIGGLAPDHTSLDELTDYYVGYVEKDAEISFPKYAIMLFAPVDESLHTELSWLTAPATFSRDFTSEPARKWQGVTTGKRSPKGRLFSGWVTGDTNEPRAENYCVTMYSDDDGETWHNLYIIDNPDPNTKINDVQIWFDPDGNLRMFYCQRKNGSRFDARSGVWEVVISNPDEPNVDDFIMSEPFRMFDGLLRNDPLVLSNGTWLAVPTDYTDEAITIIYASEDKGESWYKYSEVFIPNATNFEETIIVELNDGRLWMLVRADGAVCELVQTFSSDMGKTWEHPSYSGIDNPSARVQVIRLMSGALLFIGNDTRRGRTLMTAKLSYDEGATWQFSMLIDAGTTTYPDVCQAEDGRIYVCYDRDRISTVAAIIFTSFTEGEIKDLDTLPQERLLTVHQIS